MHEFIQRFGSYWSETEVEAAVWKLVGDAAAKGRLLVDLTSVELSRSTPLALLEPSTPPILPDPLPSSLEQAEDEDKEPLSAQVESGDDVLEYQGVIPGPTFDASVLEKEEDCVRFHRNLAAVTAVLTGGKLQSVAKEYHMAPSTLCYFVKRTQELGQIACVPNGSYHRERALRPEFQQVIRKLYSRHTKIHSIIEVKKVYLNYRMKPHPRAHFY